VTFSSVGNLLQDFVIYMCRGTSCLDALLVSITVFYFSGVVFILLQSVEENSPISSFFLQSFLFNLLPSLFFLDIFQYAAESCCSKSSHRLVSFNPLKTEFLPNSIYKLSSYLTGNTLRLHYEAQPINAV
jgi:hypothetical protein